MKKWLKIFGVMLILKGIVTIFLVYKGMTGFVIVDKIGTGGSFFGIIFLLVGVVLFFAAGKS